MRSPPSPSTMKPAGSSVASGRGRPWAAAPSALGYGRHAQAPSRVPVQSFAPAESAHTSPALRGSSRSRSRRSMPFAAALDEVAIVIEDEPTLGAPGERTRAGRRSTASTRAWRGPNGAPTDRRPEQDLLVPTAARSRLRRPRRARRRGPDACIHELAPPGHRRRPTPRPRGRLGGRRAGPAAARRSPSRLISTLPPDRTTATRSPSCGTLRLERLRAPPRPVRRPA